MGVPKFQPKTLSKSSGDGWPEDLVSFFNQIDDRLVHVFVPIDFLDGKRRSVVRSPFAFVNIPSPPFPLPSMLWDVQGEDDLRGQRV